MTIQVIARQANHRRAAGGSRGGIPLAVKRSADYARGANVSATATVRAKSTKGKFGYNSVGVSED